MDNRRQFMLPEEDLEFLEQYGLSWETINDGSQWLLLHGFPVPEGYNHRESIVGIRIETGYPGAQLDMVYFFPVLKRIDGKAIPASDSMQAIESKQFQRWSRHRTPQNPWRPGVDSVATHVQLIEEWLEKELRR